MIMCSTFLDAHSSTKASNPEMKESQPSDPNLLAVLKVFLKNSTKRWSLWSLLAVVNKSSGLLAKSSNFSIYFLNQYLSSWF